MSSNPNFITIEGVDGAGKSTHVERIVKGLRELGCDVVHTREPGGTGLGESLRKMALHDEMDAQTEAMLMFASRNELLKQVIRPALAAGKIVVCDRFTDSTWAYQGSKGISHQILSTLENLVHGDLQPGLTLLFDLPVEISLQRLAQTGKIPDKFEAEDKHFFQKVRDAYLQRAVDPRFKVVDSSKTIEQIATQVEGFLAQHLPKIRPVKAPGPRAFSPKA